MVTITGRVVSKSITEKGVFARIRLDSIGWKNAMRLFDVPDQENFEIGQKIQIDIYVAKIPVWTHYYSTLSEILQADLEPLPGCESPAGNIGVAPVVVDETGGTRFDIEHIPLPAQTEENMRERPND
jgi:hypothetical protein